MSELLYYEARKRFLETPEDILAIEQRYMIFLTHIVSKIALSIATDFDTATKLIPYWINYPPIQRGRSPTGTSIPWSEVGETVIASNFIRGLSEVTPSVTFPGLPSGADIRFATGDALVHLDIKITGPNDRADEVVASPNQLSGDGVKWINGVINSPVQIKGKQASMIFQPELPPIYLLNQQVLLCVTYFLKAVYIVKTLGYQPLSYLELICVPNGLLAFENPNYNLHKPQLFIPGKDEIAHRKKRTRVRMSPLSELAEWRRILIWSTS